MGPPPKSVSLWVRPLSVGLPPKCRDGTDGGGSHSAGVIEGYGARVNLREIGLGLQAILRVRTTHQYIKHYLALFNDIPEVIEADRITGEDCFIVRCVFSQPTDLEAIVDALAVHGSVTTSLVLSNAVRKQVPVRPG